MRAEAETGSKWQHQVFKVPEPLAFSSSWGGEAGRCTPRGCRCDWASVCQDVFAKVVGRKRRQPGPDQGAKRRREGPRQQDRDCYVPYRPKDFDSERG